MTGKEDDVPNITSHFWEKFLVIFSLLSCLILFLNFNVNDNGIDGNIVTFWAGRQVDSMHFAFFVYALNVFSIVIIINVTATLLLLLLCCWLLIHILLYAHNRENKCP